MGKLKRKEMPMWAKTGHSKPVTRREFLAAGIIPFAASTLVPGALGLLTSLPASAAEANCAAETSAFAPLISLNLSGGASIASNFLPRDKGGQLLASYSKVGGGTSANLTPVEEFGITQFSSTSGLLAGIRQTATAATLANTACIGVCVQSRDDSADNKFDISGMAYKAGSLGSLLPNMGTRNTPTGSNNKASTVQPPAPLAVSSFNSLSNSIGYTAALASSLTVPQRASLTKLVQNLSGAQTRKLASINSAAQVQSLVECAGIKNTGLISQGASAVDPLTNAPTVAAAWGITSGTAANAQARVFGSMVYNSLAGKAGTANLEIGGYDYHDNTRTTGDTRDTAAGAVIGRILESARLMDKSVFIYVTSDGAVSSAESTNPGSVWTSDRGSAGLALMIMYSPTGRPATTAAQIGQYTAGQVADDTHVIGSNPELAAQAVFANYLQFNKKIGLFAPITNSSTLRDSVLQGVIKVV